MDNLKLRAKALALRELSFDIFPDTYTCVVFYPLLGSLPYLDRPRRDALVARLSPETSPDLYIHLPFCLSRCAYCHFVVIGRPEKEAVARYIALLKKELRLNSDRFGRLKLRNICFGGGTPSCLGEKHLEELINSVADNFDLSELGQFSVECSPDSLTEEKLKFLLASGVNRISLGVQSITDTILAAQGREYGSGGTLAAVERLASCRIPTYNLDFIYGLKGQGLEDMDRSLELIKRFRPPSVSFNQFLSKTHKVHERARLPALRAALRRKFAPVSPFMDELLLSQELMVSGMGTLGYAMESNRFTLSDKDRCGYFLTRCGNKSHLGIGLGAHSFTGSALYINSGDYAAYSGMLESGELPVVRGHELTEAEKATGDLLLGLKLRGGVSLQAIESRRKMTLIKPARALLNKLSAIGILRGNRDEFAFTEAGMVFSDYILFKMSAEIIFALCHGRALQPNLLPLDL